MILGLKGVNSLNRQPKIYIIMTSCCQKQEDIEEFDRNKLRHVETKKNEGIPTLADIYQEMLPDDLTHKSELKEIKTFVRGKLRRVKTIEKCHKSTVEDIESEKQMDRSEIKSFDHSKLRHAITKETVMLPSMNTLRAEILPDYLPTRPELHHLQMFVRSYLKHVKTVEKQHLPSFEEIQEEISSSMGEVKKFDKTKLRRSSTIEKNTLPGLETLWSELLPDELPTKEELKELVNFAHKDLKHIEPNIKYRLPTNEDIIEEAIHSRAEVKVFRKGSLKKANTVEKNLIPNVGDLRAEIYPDYLPPRAEVDALKRFIRSTLKHVETVEKLILPNVNDIEAEKSDSGGF